MALMTVEEVAAKLRRHPHLVRRWIREGRLKGQKFGPTWMVSDRELARFLRIAPERRLTWFTTPLGDIWHATREISLNDVAVTLCGRQMDLGPGSREGREPSQSERVCIRCRRAAES